MKKFFTYFRLQGKRGLRFLPLVLVLSLLLSSALGVILHQSIASDLQSEKYQKMTVGVVGEEGGKYFELGIATLQTMDVSRFSMELVYMEEEEAAAALADDSIVAYIRIPYGFVSTASHGEIKPITYVTKRHSPGMASMFQQEVTEVASRMLAEAQKGVFGMMNAMDEKNLPDLEATSDKLFTEYVSVVLNRSLTVETEYVGMEGLSFGAYSLCGMFILMILLFGIPCSPLFIRKDRELPILLRVRGLRSPMQVMAEYAVHFLTMTVTTGLVLGVLIPYMGSTVSMIPEFSAYGTADIVKLLLSFLPVIFLMTALQFFLFEISENVVNGVLLQFFTGIGLSYIGGCFYPMGMFPQVVQMLSAVTPVGVARTYMTSFLSDSLGVVSLIFTVFYGLVFLFCTVLVRHRKLGKG